MPRRADVFTDPDLLADRLAEEARDRDARQSFTDFARAGRRRALALCALRGPSLDSHARTLTALLKIHRQRERKST